MEGANAFFKLWPLEMQRNQELLLGIDKSPLTYLIMFYMIKTNTTEKLSVRFSQISHCKSYQLFLGLTVTGVNYKPRAEFVPHSCVFMPCCTPGARNGDVISVTQKEIF